MSQDEQSILSQTPLAEYAGRVDGMQAHLEENYDYAKRIETSIDSSRKKIANDLLKMQSRLSEIKNKRGSIA